MKPVEISYKNQIGNKKQYIPNFHMLLVLILSIILLFVLFQNPSVEASAGEQQTTEATPLASNPVFAFEPITELAKLHSQPVADAPTASDAEPYLANEVDPISNVAEVAEKEPAKEPELSWESEEVKSGDNLSLIFQRKGLSARDVMAVLESENAEQLTRVHPGQKFDFKIQDGQLLAVGYDKNRLHRIEFHKTEDGFKTEEIVSKTETRRTYKSGTIESSLFIDGGKAGLSDNTIMQLADIFAWDIDFALDIRKNDAFHVLVEEEYLSDGKIISERILAAQFVNRKQTFNAVRFEDSEGNSSYYTPEGNSMRKAFLRTPVDFARISSHFNLQRKHPVLNRIRAHKGTDYAAPTGTPIRSAGDGKVAFIGQKGGYGRTVIIQHGQTYKTLYAHMSRFAKLSVGSRVKQGQIIGYVGSSGLATGPHLHYEFYVNGVVKNPVTVKLPKAMPVPDSELALFKEQTQPLILALNEYLSTNTQHASLETEPTSN